MTTNTTTTDLGEVTLGRTTYRAERMAYVSGPLAGHSNTTLIGPRGAAYFLRGYIEKGGDSGLRQVISLKSGHPLRDSRTQALVKVIELGDHIELHVPNPRPVH